MHRFYMYPTDTLTETTLTIRSEEFRHMVQVLRMKVGDEFFAFNGNGYTYTARITSIDKKELTAEVTSKKLNPADPTKTLTVFHGLSKGEKMELVAQKITELGASALVAFESNYSNVTAKTHKVERLEKICISASKQCGRSTLVQTGEILTLPQIADKLSKYDFTIVFYEKEQIETISNVVDAYPKANNVAIIVGPEGGFAPEEIALLEERGAKVCTLGKRILRTETASIAATAIIANFMKI